MYQYNGIPGEDPAEVLVRIDRKTRIAQFFDPIVLILEIDRTVIVLEGPGEGETVRLAELTFYFTFLENACSVCSENNCIVLFTAGDAGIEGVETFVLIGIETGLLVFPGCAGEQLQVLPGRTFC